jgi:ribonuclease J
MSPGIALRIHRGTHEIGGNCVKLVSGRSRLIIDLGRPLNIPVDRRVSLPSIPGLGEAKDDKKTTILISHPHADHYLPGSAPNQWSISQNGPVNAD